MRSIRILYACTILLSSLLLFLVQPILAKAILPWFGGSAGVWTTCMLFFQVMLLLGYCYAHWTTRRLSGRGQIATHLALLGASILVLPVQPFAGWTPSAGHPLAQILLLLTASVGLPYFLLSTTGPLVQWWYAQRVHQAMPYRLFAVSNLGSLAALLCFPVFLEPLTTGRQQLGGWTVAYGGFVALCAAAAVGSRDSKKDVRARTRPPAGERTLWVALAACPSILWLAVANHLSQDVAPIPLLWVVPLSVYLLSFILCFDRAGWYRPRLYRWLLPASWLAIGLVLSHRGSLSGLRWTIAAFLGGLFLTCMFCHGELARRKPESSELTSFYLMIALGGALGGVFVGVIAPQVFTMLLELPIGLALSIVLFLILWRETVSLRYVLHLSATVVVGFVLAVEVGAYTNTNLLRLRNFYGTLQVADVGSGESALRILSNGTIQHGSQFLAPDRRRIATAYYGSESGVAMAMEHYTGSGRRIGVIGLGTGTLAVYGRPGDFMRFYEINPLVLDVARSRFTYLADSRAAVDVLLGDARLSLAREQDQKFDVLVIDAFSGDSIPVHLLTREAFALYFRHLQPGGALVLNVSNRYVDLPPVVERLAEVFGKRVLLISSPTLPARNIYAADWMVVTDDSALFRDLAGASAAIFTRGRMRPWTDDYSNLFQVLR